MNCSIVSFSTPEQAKTISTQYLRDDHVLVDNSILVNNLALAAVEFAAKLESFFLEILPNAWAFSCSAVSLQQRQYALARRACKDNSTPKIYAACLAAYNSGYLHGLWIDATQEPEDIYDDINFMLSLSPVADTEACEDWAIHDFECFDSISLSEYEDVDRISALAIAIAEHGNTFALYFNYLGLDDVEQAVANFEDNYCGCFESAEDYAQDFYEQTGQLKAIEEAGIDSHYINWKAIAHDWECNGDFLFLDDSEHYVHVFHNY